MSSIHQFLFKTAFNIKKLLFLLNFKEQNQFKTFSKLKFCYEEKKKKTWCFHFYKCEIIIRHALKFREWPGHKQRRNSFTRARGKQQVIFDVVFDSPKNFQYFCFRLVKTAYFIFHMFDIKPDDLDLWDLSNSFCFTKEKK